MPPMNSTLDDFEIWIGASATSPGGSAVFPARVITSPAGPATGELKLDLRAKELQEALAIARGIDSALQTRRALGQILFRALFSEDVLSAWNQSLGYVDAGAAAGLRLRLWIDVPELAMLPWELLWDDNRKVFLATTANMAVSRYLPVPEPPLIAAHQRLRILVVVESPQGPPAVKEEEVQRLRASMVAAGNIVEPPVVLRNPKARQIQDGLQQNYHILHYLGHGQSGKLILTGDDDKPAGIADAELAVMFRGRRTLRLVVLSACHSSQTQEGGLFGGIGPSLIEARIPAVVAMQYPTVQLETAGQFNEAFYGALAKGISVDVAVNEARQSIAAGPLLEGRDWSTPVLYMGTRTGRLFNFETGEKSEVEHAWNILEVASGESAQTKSALSNLVQRFEQMATMQRQVKALIELTHQLSKMRSQLSVVQAIVDQAEGSGQKLAPLFNNLKSAWNELAQSAEGLRLFLVTHPEIAGGQWFSELCASAKLIEGHLKVQALRPLATDAFDDFASKLGTAEAFLDREVDRVLAEVVSLSDRTLGAILRT
jgi:hypothetical protein